MNRAQFRDHKAIEGPQTVLQDQDHSVSHW